MYTFVWTLEQLERATDLQSVGILRIIHILCEDGAAWDQYVTIVDCAPAQATLLHLL